MNLHLIHPLFLHPYRPKGETVFPLGPTNLTDLNSPFLSVLSLDQFHLGSTSAVVFRIPLSPGPGEPHPRPISLPFPFLLLRT